MSESWKLVSRVHIDRVYSYYMWTSVLNRREVTGRHDLKFKNFDVGAGSAEKSKSPLITNKKRPLYTSHHSLNGNGDFQFLWE